MEKSWKSIGPKVYEPCLEAEKQGTGKQRRPAKQPPSSRAPKKRLFSPAPDAAPLAGVTPGATSAAPPTITWPADGVTPNPVWLLLPIKWLHEACTDGSTHYLCLLCDKE